MTNITPLYWEASGESLHTLAWAITTKGGSRNKGPDKRGDDLSVPLLTGRVPTKKFRDSRAMDLPMWTQPCNPDGSLDDTMNDEAKAFNNWEHIISLFDAADQVPLVKRFYGSDGTIKSATAMVELLEYPEPTIIADNTWGFTVTVWLADPYFYGEPVTVPIGTIDVDGNADTDHVSVSVAQGVRVTDADGNWIQSGAAGTTVIDMHKRTAKVGASYVNGLITRNLNFPNWLILHRGSNALQGAGSITYEPAYK